MKAQDAYYLANAQASYDDWRRARRQWDYFYRSIPSPFTPSLALRTAERDRAPASPEGPSLALQRSTTWARAQHSNGNSNSNSGEA